MSLKGQMMNLFSRRKREVLDAARAQRTARQREADAELLLDDIRSGFAGRAALDDFVAREDRETGYKSAIGEDWPEGM